MNPAHRLIYKVFTASQWTEAMRDGVFRGAPIDLEDGYIHFSAHHQVQETVEKHFKGQSGLVLAAFETKAFGDKLKWEVSRGGDQFPHVYDVLDMSSIEAHYVLTDQPDGGHQFPETY